MLENMQPKTAIFPVLKSNAYGHGIEVVSQILADTSVPYICVDSYPEYQAVKDHAKKKSLVLGETLIENFSLYDPKWATLCVYNLDTVRWLVNQSKSFTIHLFLNT